MLYRPIFAVIFLSKFGPNGLLINERIKLKTRKNKNIIRVTKIRAYKLFFYNAYKSLSLHYS